MKICFALIHNNNAQRNAYIQPRLEELSTSLAEKWPTRMIEVSAQPEIRPHGLPMAFLRDVMYELLDRDWQRYRFLRSRTFRGTLVFLLRSYRKYKQGGGWKRSSFIETAVTDKHIRAWSAFLDSDADFLLCFEDDAVFKEDSVQRVHDLIEMLTHRTGNGPIYVDLAGGLPVRRVKN